MWVYGSTVEASTQEIRCLCFWTLQMSTQGVTKGWPLTLTIMQLYLWNNTWEQVLAGACDLAHIVFENVNIWLAEKYTNKSFHCVQCKWTNVSLPRKTPLFLGKLSKLDICFGEFLGKKIQQHQNLNPIQCNL